MREASTEPLSPGTWIAQLRQLQSGVTQLITTHRQRPDRPRAAARAARPDPRRPLLARHAAGAGRHRAHRRHRLARAVRRARRRGRGHRPPGQRAGRLRAGHRHPADRERRSASRTVRTGGDDLGGAEAYAAVRRPDRRPDRRHRPAARHQRRRRPPQRADQRRHHARRPAGHASCWPSSSPACCSTRSARCARAPATVAHEQLPEAVARIRAGDDPGPITPIDVTTHEEVGQLARAVDDLHRQAVTLASGEARLRSQVSEMFITLVAPQHLADQPAARPDRDAREGRGGPAPAREPVPARPPRGPHASHRRQPARPRRRAHPHQRRGRPHRRRRRSRRRPPACRTTSASGSAPPATPRISDAAAADVVHLLTELVDNALAYSAPTTDGRWSARRPRPTA